MAHLKSARNPSSSNRLVVSREEFESAIDHCAIVSGWEHRVPTPTEISFIYIQRLEQRLGDLEREISILKEKRVNED